LILFLYFFGFLRLLGRWAWPGRSLVRDEARLRLKLRRGKARQFFAKSLANFLAFFTIFDRK
jgi:hypothetical protein